MKKQEKISLVETLKETIKNAKSIVVVDYQGLPNKDLQALRREVELVGGQFLVIKNTLLKRALETEIEFAGPSAVLFANEDEIAPIQAVGRVIKEKQLPKLKFGIFSGILIDKDKLTLIANLPKKEVLVANVIGSITSPLYSLVSTLQASIQNIVFVLNAKAQKE